MDQTLLAKLARALESAGIPYMVIGGQAVLLHGEPRLTRDIDITLGIDNLALESILQVASSILSNLKNKRPRFASKKVCEHHRTFTNKEGDPV